MVGKALSKSFEAMYQLFYQQKLHFLIWYLCYCFMILKNKLLA